jgi:hypothetical protein
MLWLKKGSLANAAAASAADDYDDDLCLQFWYSFDINPIFYIF